MVSRDKIKTMTEILKKLNSEQRAAVKHGNGPLLLIAGPGTGKTMALTHRIAYLIKEKGIHPDNILALTFTNKAADEMEERVDRLLDSPTLDLQVYTFHSLGQEIIQNDGLDIGLPYNFKLLKEKNLRLLIKNNLQRFNLDYFQPVGKPHQFIAALIQHFSRCKDEGIGPEDYREFVKKKNDDDDDLRKATELAEAYRVYQKILAENDGLDFGDLIYYPWKLFKKRSAIRKKYQQQYQYILIDEFQDLNYIQYELIKLIGGSDNNITAAVDDDQSIYGFRGTSFNNALQFNQDFPKAEIITLKKNYRSRQNILDLSYEFIQNNNPYRIEHQLSQQDGWSVDKKLQSISENKGEIIHLHAVDLNQEVREVVKKTVDLIETGVKPSEIAILGRTNKSLRAFEEALKEARIPYQSLTEENFYHQPVVIDLNSYLRVLYNHYNSSSFYRLLNLPCFDIKSDDISQITRFSKRKSLSIYEVIQKPSFLEKLSSKSQKEIKRLLNLIQKQAQSLKEDLISNLIVDFLEESGYLQKVLQKDDQKKSKETHLLNRFYNQIVDFEKNNAGGRLYDLIDQMETEQNLGNSIDPSRFDQGPEGVRVMTVHSAKGLEFEYVFLINLVSRRFPTDNRSRPIDFPDEFIKEKFIDEDNSGREKHRQEERRLFYVGLTRAKKGLFLTSAEDYGGKRRKKVSKFIKELPTDKVEKKEPETTAQLKRSKEVVSTAEFKDKRPDHFSFSQLTSFDRCPRQYKYTYLLKIPTRGGASRSFGTSIHQTLYNFLKKTTEEDNFPASKEKLLEIYQQNWLDEWYVSATERKRAFQKGREMLIDFYKRFQERSPEIYQEEGGAFLEKPFQFKINGEKIIGKIDRLDQLKEGVEIIDYKTGQPKEKLNAERRLQLSIYQLAVEKVFGLEVAKMSFYYLQDGSKLSFTADEKDLEKVKETIRKRMEAIKNSDFSPTPGFSCQYCDFQNVCDESEA